MNLYVFTAGLISLALSGVAYVVAHRIFARHNWNPIRTSLRFDQPGIVETSFVADLQTSYCVEIDYQKTISFHEIASIPFGDDFYQVRHSNGKRVDIPSEGMSYGASIAQTVCCFKAFAGETYTLVMRVPYFPAVKILDPHLEVSINPSTFKEHYVRSSAVYCMSQACCALGIVLLIISLFVG